jgi:hypothetical protein
MAWKQGESGNPNGRPPVKPWRKALDMALAQDDADETKPGRLRRAAESLLTAAADGDLAAIKELGDRIDGKSIQEIAAKIDATLEVTVKNFTLPTGEN